MEIVTGRCRRSSRRVERLFGGRQAGIGIAHRLFGGGQCDVSGSQRRGARGQVGLPRGHFAGELRIAGRQVLEFELERLQAGVGRFAFPCQTVASFTSYRAARFGLRVRNLRGGPRFARRFLSLFGAGHRGARTREFGVRGGDFGPGLLERGGALADFGGQRIAPPGQLRIKGHCVGEGARRLLVRSFGFAALPCRELTPAMRQRRGFARRDDGLFGRGEGLLCSGDPGGRGSLPRAKPREFGAKRE